MCGLHLGKQSKIPLRSGSRAWYSTFPRGGHDSSSSAFWFYLQPIARKNWRSAWQFAMSTYHPQKLSVHLHSPNKFDFALLNVNIRPYDIITYYSFLEIIFLKFISFHPYSMTRSWTGHYFLRKIRSTEVKWHAFK